MGLRIAEIDEHPIAHVLRDEPSEALHSLGDALLISGNDLAQVFRVHACRECCRTDEVREHHGDLPALGGVLRGLRLHMGRRRRRRCAFGDGFQEPHSMAERGDAELLQIGVCELREKSKIDVILGKALEVLSETELLKPLQQPAASR